MEVIKNFADFESLAEIKVNHVPLLRPENLIIGTWIWYSVDDRLFFSESFSKMAGISKDSYHNFKTFVRSRVFACETLRTRNY